MKLQLPANIPAVSFVLNLVGSWRRCFRAPRIIVKHIENIASYRALLRSNVMSSARFPVSQELPGRRRWRRFGRDRQRVHRPRWGLRRRRLGPGDGTPTSDSNVALVSDGEYIVNAKGASKNRALLAAVNSGKAPKFSGSSQAGVLTSNIHAPTVNVHVEGGSQERQLAQRIAGHVGDTLNKVNRFRPSATQQHASAASSISKAHSKKRLGPPSHVTYTTLRGHKRSNFCI